MDNGAEDLLCENMKLSLSKLFKQRTEIGSISIHFQTGVSFSNWQRAMKIQGKLQSTRKNMHVLSTTLHSTEWQISGAHTLELLLTFLVHV